MYGKRAQPKQCANPLFVQWLGEWLDKEREKDTNFKFVLQKAYTNMQEWPEVLASGKDAMRVKGIGQKLADMLERKRLQTGAASGAGGQTLAGGSSQAGPQPGSSQSMDSATAAPAPKAAPKKRKQAAADPTADTGSGEPAAQPAKKKRAPKPYVPEYRSGAYALLVALYLEKYGPAGRDTMLKADLMRKAEEHCNSSFTEASDKNGWHTAWDSMTKLRDKGLVCKIGNPASYALTEPDGENLAKACVELGKQQSREADAPPPMSARSTESFAARDRDVFTAPGPKEGGTFIRTEDLAKYLGDRQSGKSRPKDPTVSSIPAIPSSDPPFAARKPPIRPPQPAADDGPICLDSDSDDDAPASQYRSNFGSSQFAPPSSQGGIPSSQPRMPATSALHASFQFDYLESATARVFSKDQAEVRFVGREMHLRIRFHSRQSGHPFVMANVLDRSLAPLDGFLSGWVRDDVAPVSSPGIDVTALMAPPPTPPSKKAPAKQKEPDVPRAEPPRADYGRSAAPPPIAIPNPSTAPWKGFGSAPSSAAPSAGAGTSSTLAGRASAGASATPTVTELKGTPIVLQRGTYDVVLVLDTRENKTKTYASFQERDWMLERLYSRGIKAETRVLELGDFCWMAKPKGAAAGQGEEIMLDFVIERKAIDDLKISIHEGRFEEQKFRMVNCGIPNVIYVIEGTLPRGDPTWAEHLKKMYSAMSLLQVGHGFFLKQTRNKEDTVRYLEQMTIWIQQVYLTENVYAIPDGALQKNSWRDMREHAEQRDGRHYHISFAAFNELNSKSRNLLLRDAYVKQLLCIRGVSVEKAVVIATKYPTLRSLLESLRKEATDTAKVKQLMALTDEGAPTRRKIGKAVAERIVEILCGSVYKQRVVAAAADDDD